MLTIAAHRKSCPRLDLDSFRTSVEQFKTELFQLSFGLGEQKPNARPLYEKIVEANTALKTAVVEYLKASCDDLAGDPELVRKYGLDAKKKVEEEMARAMN